jgi:tetratricopeptide (TPR) repeat protein
MAFPAAIVFNYFRGWSLLESAQRAIERRDFAQAYRDLHDYLQINSGDGEMQFLAGRTARRAKSYSEALTHLARAEELGWVPESVALERALLRAQQGDLDGIEEPLQQQVAAKHPDAALILEALIEGYLVTFRPDSAKLALVRLLELEPNNGQAWLWRGLLLAQLQRPEEAVKAYQRGLELLEEDEQGSLQYAYVLLSLGRHRDALPHFERLAQRLPDRPDVLLGLAACRRQLGQGALARPTVERLVARADRLPAHLQAQAFLECGRLAYDAGDLATAETYLRRAETLDPNHQEGLFALASCLQARGKAEEAAELRLRHARLEKLNLELTTVVRQISSNPADVELRCRAGVIALKAGQFQQAQLWLRSVLRTNPAHAGALKALKELDQKTGSASPLP